MSWQTEPGIYPGIPESEYHAAPLLSSSGLARINRSPAHFGVPVKSASFQLGSLVHCMVLEPDAVSTRYARAPKVDRRTKAGKEEWAAFVADNEGREHVTADDWDKADRMFNAVVDHSEAMAIIDEGTGTELTATWEEQGVMCKARLDLVTPWGGVDLKTCKDASYSGFQRSVVNYLYHQQGAHYMKGLAVHGRPCDFWKWICIENSEPYCVVVYTADDELLRMGEALRQKNLNQYIACDWSGQWTGYQGGVISAPGWYHVEEIEEEHEVAA